MIKCLLTLSLGRAKYFPVRPSHSVNKYILTHETIPNHHAPELGQNAAITTTLGIGSEKRDTKNDTKETMDSYS